MKNQIKHLVFALALLGLVLNPQFSTALAQGSLTPPGPPGPTMRTLLQIEPRIPISSLPYMITNPGSYYVTTNLTGVSGADGIIISNVTDVTIDLKGFTLLGISGSGNGLNVVGPSSNVAIHNGVLDSWGGVGVDAVNANNSQFERLRVSNCGEGLDAGTNCVISDCTSTGNHGLGTGISVEDNCIVKDCISSTNYEYSGIFANNNCTIKNCTTCDNFQLGIETGKNCTVEDCTASGNLDGIDANDNNCTVKDCTANGNGTGIQVQNNSTISTCTASGNGTGIQVQNNSTITTCTASGNTYNGIFVGNNCNVTGCTASGNEAGIEVDGGNSRVDGNNFANNSGYGIYADFLNAGNVITRNSAPGNGTANYYHYSGNNDYGPTNQTPATATSPWANF